MTTLIVDAQWAEKNAGDVVSYDGKDYTIGTDAFASLDAALIAASADVNVTTIEIASDINEEATSNYTFGHDVAIKAPSAVKVTFKNAPVFYIENSTLTWDKNIDLATPHFSPGCNYSNGNIVFNGNVEFSTIVNYAGSSSMTISKGAEVSGSSITGYGTDFKIDITGQLTDTKDVTLSSAAKSLSASSVQLEDWYIGDTGVRAFNMTNAYVELTTGLYHFETSELAVSLTNSALVVSGEGVAMEGSNGGVFALNSGSRLKASAVALVNGYTLDVNGSSVEVAGTISNKGAITLDIASTLKADAITGNGTITIDAAGFTAGTLKIIDLTNNSPLKGKVEIINLAEGVNVRYGADGDVTLTDQSVSVVYVDKAWAGTAEGTILGEDKEFGVTAFADLKSAVAAADSGATIVLLNSGDVDANDVDIVGKDLTLDGENVNLVSSRVDFQNTTVVLTKDMTLTQNGVAAGAPFGYSKAVGTVFDLGGKELKINGMMVFEYSTIKNGTLTINSNAGVNTNGGITICFQADWTTGAKDGTGPNNKVTIAADATFHVTETSGLTIYANTDVYGKLINESTVGNNTIIGNADSWGETPNGVTVKVSGTGAEFVNTTRGLTIYGESMNATPDFKLLVEDGGKATLGTVTNAGAIEVNDATLSAKSISNTASASVAVTGESKIAFDTFTATTNVRFGNVEDHSKITVGSVSGNGASITDHRIDFVNTDVTLADDLTLNVDKNSTASAAQIKIWEGKVDLEGHTLYANGHFTVGDAGQGVKFEDGRVEVNAMGGKAGWNNVCFQYYGHEVGADVEFVVTDTAAFNVYGDTTVYGTVTVNHSATGYDNVGGGFDEEGLAAGSHFKISGENASFTVTRADSTQQYMYRIWGAMSKSGAGVLTVENGAVFDVQGAVYNYSKVNINNAELFKAASLENTGTITIKGSDFVVNDLKNTGSITINAGAMVSINNKLTGTGTITIDLTGGSMYDKKIIDLADDANVDYSQIVSNWDEVKDRVQVVDNDLIVKGKKNAETKTWVLENVDDFKAFRDEVNAGNNFAGWTITLAADIDLNNEEWTPIGTGSTPFNGVFDGGNHTISNLKITGNKSNAGLFGRTNNGEVKNFTLHNAYVTGDSNVGAVAGTPYTTKYTNITLTGDVYVAGSAYVGGMFGKNAYADLTDLTINANAGSLVKAESGTSYRTYVGGVVGFMGEGGHTLTNINSNINVEGSTCDVGGITGIAHYGNNFVNVNCTADSIKVTNGDVDAYKEIGGIAGVWHNQAGYEVTFENCTVGSNTNISAIVGGEDMSDYVAGNTLTGAAYNAGNVGDASGDLQIIQTSGYYDILADTTWNNVNFTGNVSVGFNKYAVPGLTLTLGKDVNVAGHIYVGDKTGTDQKYESGDQHYLKIADGNTATLSGINVRVTGNLSVTGKATLYVTSDACLTGTILVNDGYLLTSHASIYRNATVSVTNNGVFRHGYIYEGDGADIGATVSVTDNSIYAADGWYLQGGVKITVDASSQVLLSRLRNNDPAGENFITIDTTGFVGYTKVIDMFADYDNATKQVVNSSYTGTVDAADYEKMIANWDEIKDMAVVKDGDLYIQNVDTSKLYVNSDYAGKGYVYGQEVAEGRFYGINAFGSYNNEVIEVAKNLYMSTATTVEWNGRLYAIEAGEKLTGEVVIEKGNFYLDNEHASQSNGLYIITYMTDSDGNLLDEDGNLLQPGQKPVVISKTGGLPGLAVTVLDGAALNSQQSKLDMLFPITIKAGGAFNFDKSGKTIHIMNTLTVGEQGAAERASMNFISTIDIRWNGNIKLYSTDATWTGFINGGGFSAEDSNINVNGKFTASNSGTENITDSTLNITGSGSTLKTMKFTNSAVTVSENVAVEVSSVTLVDSTLSVGALNMTGNITMDMASTLAFNSVSMSSGKKIIISDIADYQGGAFKLIDYTGNEAFVEEYYRAMLGDVWNDNYKVIGNDLFLNDSSDVYVNADYVGKEFGEEIAEGKYAGINAFSSLKDAVDAVSNGGKITVEGDKVIDGDDAYVNGKNITLAGKGTIYNDSGWIRIAKDGDSTVTVAEGSDIVIRSSSGDHAINVSGLELNADGTTHRYNGKLVVDKGHLFADYVIDRGVVDVKGDGDAYSDKANMSANHFGVASEGVNTAELNLTDKAYFKMAGDAALNVTETGEVNVNDSKLEGDIVNAGEVNVTKSGLVDGDVNNVGVFNVDGGTVTGESFVNNSKLVLSGFTAGAEREIVLQITLEGGEGSIKKSVTIEKNKTSMTLYFDDLVDGRYTITSLDMAEPDPFNMMKTSQQMVHNGEFYVNNGVIDIAELNVGKGTALVSGESKLTVDTLKGTLKVADGTTLVDSNVGGTVLLLGDLDVEGGLTADAVYSYGSADAPIDVEINGDKIIGGHGLFYRGNFVYNADMEYGYVYFSYDGTHTVNSAVVATTNQVDAAFFINGDVTVVNGASLTATNGNILFNNGSDAKLTIEEGATVTAAGNVGSWYDAGIGAIINIDGTLSAKSIANKGAITISTTGLLQAQTITGNGTITIDATDFIGFKRVIDLSGTESLEGKVNFTNLADNVKVIYGADGDVSLTTATADHVYVNNAWKNKEFGDEVGTGKFVGINAYGLLRDAATVVNPNGTITLEGGETISGDDAYISGKNVTLSGNGKIYNNSGWIRIGKDGDATVTIAEDSDIAISSNGGDHAINVSGLEYNADGTTHRYNGKLVVDNAHLFADYVIDRGIVEVKGNSTAYSDKANMSANHFGVESEGVNTAELNLTDKAYFKMTGDAALNVKATGKVTVNDSKLEGDIDNKGSVAVSNNGIVKAGTIDNSGTLTVDNATVEAGTIDNSGTLTVDDATVKAGKVVNSGSLNIYTDNFNADSVENSGMMYVVDAKLTDQNITGNGYLVANDSVLKNNSIKGQASYLVGVEINGGSFAGTGEVYTGYGWVNGAWDYDRDSTTVINGKVDASDKYWGNYGKMVVEADAEWSVDYYQGGSKLNTFKSGAVVNADTFQIYNGLVKAGAVVNADGAVQLYGRDGGAQVDINGVVTVEHNESMAVNLYIGFDTINQGSWVIGGADTVVNVSGTGAKLQALEGAAGKATAIVNKDDIGKAAQLNITDNAEMVVEGTLQVKGGVLLDNASMNVEELTNSGVIDIVNGADARFDYVYNSGSITLDNASLTVDGILEFKKGYTSTPGGWINMDIFSTITAEEIDPNGFGNYHGFNITVTDADLAALDPDTKLIKLIEQTDDSASDVSRNIFLNGNRLASRDLEAAEIGDYSIVSIGNDVYLVKGNRDEFYIGDIYADMDYGTVAGDGMIVGFNTFGSMTEVEQLLSNTRSTFTINVMSDADFVMNGNAYYQTFKFVNGSDSTVTVDIVNNLTAAPKRYFGEFEIGKGVTLKQDASIFYATKGGVIAGTLDVNYYYQGGDIGDPRKTVTIEKTGKLISGGDALQVKGETGLIVKGEIESTSSVQVWNAASLPGDAKLEVIGGKVTADGLKMWGGNGSQTTIISDGGKVNVRVFEADQTSQVTVTGEGSELNVSGSGAVGVARPSTGYLYVKDGASASFGSLTVGKDGEVYLTNATLTAGTLTNTGAAFEVTGSTLKVNKLDNDAAMFLSGTNTIQVEDATGSGFAIRANNGVTLNDSYIKAGGNETLRMLGSMTVNGGLQVAYLQGSSAGVGGTLTIENGTVVNASYGVEFSTDYVLNGGKIVLSGGNASGKIWGFVFQNGEFTINTDVEVIGGGATAPIHFTNATAMVNSTITQKSSGGEVIYLKNSAVTIGKTGVMKSETGVFVNAGSTLTVAGAVNGKSLKVNAADAKVIMNGGTVDTADKIANAGSIIITGDNSVIADEITGDGLFQVANGEFTTSAAITAGKLVVGKSGSSVFNENKASDSGAVLNLKHNLTITGTKDDETKIWVGYGRNEDNLLANQGKFVLNISNGAHVVSNSFCVDNAGVANVSGNAYLDVHYTKIRGVMTVTDSTLIADSRMNVYGEEIVNDANEQVVGKAVFTATNSTVEVSADLIVGKANNEYRVGSFIANNSTVKANSLVVNTASDMTFNGGSMTVTTTAVNNGTINVDNATLNIGTMTNNGVLNISGTSTVNANIIGGGNNKVVFDQAVLSGVITGSADAVVKNSSGNAGLTITGEDTSVTLKSLEINRYSFVKNGAELAVGDVNVKSGYLHVSGNGSKLTADTFSGALSVTGATATVGTLSNVDPKGQAMSVVGNGEDQGILNVGTMTTARALEIKNGGVVNAETFNAVAAVYVKADGKLTVTDTLVEVDNGNVSVNGAGAVIDAKNIETVRMNVSNGGKVIAENLTGAVKVSGGVLNVTDTLNANTTLNSVDFKDASDVVIGTLAVSSKVNMSGNSTVKVGTVNNEGTISVKNSTFEAGTFTNNGALNITVGDASKFTVTDFAGANGSITLTVDGTSSLVKVIDAAANGTIDYGTITVTNAGYTTFVVDNDLMATNASRDVIYVSSAYTSQEAVAAKGYVYGYNAFATLNDVANVIATDGSATIIKFESDIEAGDVLFNYGAGDITFTADTAVTIKQNAASSDWDFVTGGVTPTITIGENVTFQINENNSGAYFYYGAKLNVEGTITGGENWGCLYLGVSNGHTVGATGTVSTGRVHLRWSDLTVNGDAASDRTDAHIDTNYLLVEESTFTANNAIIDAKVVYDSNNGSLRDGASTFNINNSVLVAEKVELKHKDSVFNVTGASTVKFDTFTGVGNVRFGNDMNKASDLTFGSANGNGAVLKDDRIDFVNTDLTLIDDLTLTVNSNSAAESAMIKFWGGKIDLKGNTLYANGQITFGDGSRPDGVTLTGGEMVINGRGGRSGWANITFQRYNHLIAEDATLTIVDAQQFCVYGTTTVNGVVTVHHAGTTAYDNIGGGFDSTNYAAGSELKISGENASFTLTLNDNMTQYMFRIWGSMANYSGAGKLTVEDGAVFDVEGTVYNYTTSRVGGDDAEIVVNKAELFKVSALENHSTVTITDSTAVIGKLVNKGTISVANAVVNFTNVTNNGTVTVNGTSTVNANITGSGSLVFEKAVLSGVITGKADAVVKDITENAPGLKVTGEDTSVTLNSLEINQYSAVNGGAELNVESIEILDGYLSVSGKNTELNADTVTGTVHITGAVANIGTFAGKQMNIAGDADGNKGTLNVGTMSNSLTLKVDNGGVINAETFNGNSAVNINAGGTLNVTDTLNYKANFEVNGAGAVVNAGTVNEKGSDIKIYNGGALNAVNYNGGALVGTKGSAGTLNVSGTLTASDAITYANASQGKIGTLVVNASANVMSGSSVEAETVINNNIVWVNNSTLSVGEFTNNGTLKLTWGENYKFTVENFDGAAGKITLDLSGVTDSVVKVVDASATGTVDYGTVTVNGYNTFVLDNDLMATNASRETIYVNSAYTSQAAVGSYVYGYNAFASVADAVASTNSTDTTKIVVDGGTLSGRSYFGGYTAEILGGTTLADGGYICGGSASAANGVNLTITNLKGGDTGYIFASYSDVNGDVHMTINQAANTQLLGGAGGIWGGSWDGTVTGDIYLTVNGTGVDAAYNVYENVSSWGKLGRVNGRLVGGGYDSLVNGNIALKVSNVQFNQRIIGGGEYGDVIGNINVDIDNVRANYGIVGGGFRGGNVTGDVVVDAKQVIFANAAKDSGSGGSERGWIIGGGWDGDVDGNVTMNLDQVKAVIDFNGGENGQNQSTIIAGGYKGDVTGDVTMNLKDVKAELIYGAGFDGNVGGDVDLKFNNVTASEIYVAGSNSTITGALNSEFSGKVSAEKVLDFGNGTAEIVAGAEVTAGEMKNAGKVNVTDATVTADKIANNGVFSVSGSSTLNGTFTGNSIKFAENTVLTSTSGAVFESSYTVGKMTFASGNFTFNHLYLDDVTLKSGAEVKVKGTLAVYNNDVITVDAGYNNDVITVDAGAEVIANSIFLNGGSMVVNGKFSSLQGGGDGGLILNGNGSTITVNANAVMDVTYVDIYKTSGNSTVDVYGTANVNFKLSDGTGKFTWNIYEGAELNAGKNGIVMNNAESVINIDALATLTGTTFTGNGSFVIDAAGFTGTRKVIDLAGNQSLQGKVTIKNAEDGVYAIYGDDGDVILTNTDTSTIYISTAYDDIAAGTIVDGKMVGANAFESLTDIGANSNGTLTLNSATNKIVLTAGNTVSYGNLKPGQAVTIETEGNGYALVDRILSEYLTPSEMVIAEGAKIYVNGTGKTSGANSDCPMTINGELKVGTAGSGFYVWSRGELVINKGGILTLEDGKFQNSGTMTVYGTMNICKGGWTPKLAGNETGTVGHLIVDGKDGEGVLSVNNVQLAFGGGHCSAGWKDAGEGCTVTVQNGGKITSSAASFRNGVNSTITLNNGTLEFTSVINESIGGNYFDNKGVIKASNGSVIDMTDRAFTNDGTITLDNTSMISAAFVNSASGTISMDVDSVIKFTEFTNAGTITIDLTDESKVNAAAGSVLFDRYDAGWTLDNYKSLFGANWTADMDKYLTVNANGDLAIKSSVVVYVNSDYTDADLTDGDKFRTHDEALASGAIKVITVGGTAAGNIEHDGAEGIISSGTFNGTVSGGAITASDKKNWDDREGSTMLTVNGGTFNKMFIGGDRVNVGNTERIGDINTVINGGTFTATVVGGMVYADKSLHGQALLTGDVNLTIAGGTFANNIYGGSNAASEAYSTRSVIDGNVNIVVDASSNQIAFAANKTLVAGSYREGAIGGNTHVTFTGLASNITFGDNFEVWGGSSGDIYVINGDTRTFQSSVSGDRIFTFNGFSGEISSSIRGFNVMEVVGGSDVDLLSGNFKDIEVWNFEAGSMLGGTFTNDFSGDTLNIDLGDWTGSSAVLMDGAESMFGGFESLTSVKIGGTALTLNGDVWSGAGYELKLESDEDSTMLTLNKLA